MITTDTAAEKGVLGGILRYGSSAYHDIVGIITPNTFSEESNSILFSCIQHIFKEDSNAKLDLATIYSAANELGLGHVYKKPDETKYISALMNYPIDQDNVKKFAAKIRKLEIAKIYDGSLANARRQLASIDGTETVSEIIGIGEKAIFDFGNLILDKADEPCLVGSGIDAMLDELESNPVDQVGISTGYKKYDYAIGGGLRKGTVNVFGARPKVGKTQLADNIGKFISSEYGIPVLNIDTEMQIEDHQHRTLAMISGVKIDDIETGKFSKNQILRKKVRDAANKIKNMKYFHKRVGGYAVDEILAIIKRWIIKEVGININGEANPCVVIYDYLKLMDSADINSNTSEFQAIGFLLTKLHDMAAKYKLPILAFVQLNRDGITKEDTDSVSQSDRIIWLCSNFTIYKAKSDEEIAMDGPENGTRKLVPIIARHGKGLNSGEYINMIFDGSIARIEEGLTNFEIKNGSERKVTKTDDKQQQLSDQYEPEDTGEDIFRPT